jgi:hypothetical protein
MMWHVGVLYRITDMLELIAEKPAFQASLLHEFSGYRGVSTKLIVDVSVFAGWIESDACGHLILTNAGRDLIEIQTPMLRLRSQVSTLVGLANPTWAALTIQGRDAFSEYAPPEVVQCFREAGILNSYDPDVIALWDSISARYRKAQDKERVSVGRKGERLSYDYERTRTGVTPQWIALEFEGAGYDILSRASTDNSRALLIEVKTSRERWSRAVFYLTRHEWLVLNGNHESVLHLWSVESAKPLYAIVPIANVTPHIPNDQGSGQWETATCPFADFEPRVAL